MSSDYKNLKRKWESKDEEPPEVIPVGGSLQELQDSRTKKMIHDFMEKSIEIPDITTDSLTQSIELQRKKLDIMEEFLKIIKKEGGIPIKMKNDLDNVVVVREITKDKAKEEIIEYFKEHPNRDIFPTDLNIELKIPYDLVVEILDDLEDENLIEEG